MEDRLKRSHHHPRPSISQVQGQVPAKKAVPASLDTTTNEDVKARSRPGTARETQQAPSAGNMPPTPGASEGEYYLITQDDLDEPRR